MRTRVWIPETQSVESCNLVVDLPTIGLEGYYYIDLIDKDTGKVKQHLEFKNIITDFALDTIMSSFTTLTNGVFRFCGVGTGSSTPNASQTSLDNQVGGRITTGTADSFGTNTAPEYHWLRINRRFIESEVNGLLTEVAFFTSATGNNMTSRALFLDARGQPTTITKTNQDLLDITYEIRLYAPTQDVTGTFEFRPGTSSVYTIRPQGVLQTSGWVAMMNRISAWLPSAFATSGTFFNTRTGFNNPSQGSLVSQVSSSTYITSTYTRDVRFFWNDLAANFDIATIVWRFVDRIGGDADWHWQMSLNPPVQKVVDQRFDLFLRQTIGRV